MAIIVWLAIFWMTFLFPIHVYPFPDLFNQLIGMVLSAGLLFCVVIKSRSQSFAVPRVAVGIVGLCLAVLLSAIFQNGPRYTDYTYTMYLLSGFLILFSVANIPIAKEELISRIASTLMWISVVTAIYGLLRHYGILKYILPWVVSDGDRLLGPLNQANLTALVLSIGIVSVVFFSIFGKLTLRFSLVATLIMAFSAGLTGSRAFVAFLLIVTCIPIFKYTLHRMTGRPVEFCKGAGCLRALSIVVFALIVSLSAPIIDRPLSSVLIDAGLLDRRTDQNILERLTGSGYYRLEEWKKLQFSDQVIANPFFGVGAGRYGVFSNQVDSLMVDPDRLGTLWVHGHNILVNMFVELGYVGLLMVLGLLIYLSVLFVMVKASTENIFIYSILFILIFNNMVEFSFWFYGFFALALSLIVLQDGKFVVSFTSRALPVFLSIVIFITALGTSFYVAKDAWSAIIGFHKAELTQEELYKFHDAKSNRFVGGDAFRAEIIRSSPTLFGVEEQLNKLERLISWRPEMVFMLRYAVLRAVVGPEDEACNIVERTVRVFPHSLDRLSEELHQAKSLGATFDISAINRCLANGMMYWVRKGS